MTDNERAPLIAAAKIADGNTDFFGTRLLLAAVEAEADARLPLGEPCRSCTGRIRENNPIRCAECSPTAHQNYEEADQ